jgi:hypothetical protein
MTSQILTDGQKQLLSPYLNVICIVLAVIGGIAISSLFGGPEIPFVSKFAAIIMGVVGGLVIYRNLRK